LLSKNVFEISGPKAIDTPLLLGCLPITELGSAHNKSHIFPFSGI